MNCEAYASAIGDLVDGPLDAERQRGLDAHLGECPSCRLLVEDLRRIRAAAADLPVHRPPERVWERVRAQLPAIVAAAKAPGSDVSAPPRTWRSYGAVFTAPRWRLAWGAGLFVALAATLLVVALPYFRSAAPRPPAAAPRTAAAGTPVHAATSDLVQSVESEMQQAEQHYEKAIAGLEQIAKAGEGNLDPQLAGTLRHNLEIIDQAIHESRVALASQPANQLAQESLFEAFRRKIGLLQDTVTLINEMRKGNQATTAKIIGNMQKS